MKRTFIQLIAVIFAFTFFSIIYLDSIVKNEFSQQAWDIPAKVYARPLEFSIGQPIKLEAIYRELALLGYRKKIKVVSSGEYERYKKGKTSVFIIRTRNFRFWDGEIPAQTIQLSINDGKITQLINFTEQSNLNYVRLDPLYLGDIHLASNGNLQDRKLIELSDLPSKFIQTLLIMEDASFYNHWGLSISGIARAIKDNLSEGKISSGGSTITQQLIKNHFLTNQRSFLRKGKEAIMSLLTEIHNDKNVILAAYINEIYLGQDQQIAIHGFSRASEFYFDLPINQLELHQIALLVGIVKGASFYNPRKHPQRAIERRNLVLKKMLDNDLITESSFRNALVKTLEVVSRPPIRTSRVPAFKSLVRKELLDNYSSKALSRDGFRVFTSLDPIKQHAAEKALKSRIAKLNKNGSLQGAIILADIKNSEVTAVVGDKNANYVGFNRALNAQRQTGSIIKPFVYLTALQKPSQFNLVSKISDKAFSVTGSDGSLWSPKNYDRIEHGDEDSNVLLEDALLNSYNLATANLALAVGINEVIETIEKFGFTKSILAYPSIALGSKEMSVFEVLKLYQGIANNGIAIKPSAIIAVQSQKGKLLKRYSKTSHSVIDEESAFLIRYLLSKVTQIGTAKSIAKHFPDKVLAGKTGTTNDLKDSWYVGFDEKQLAVVWLGQDNNRPINLTGATGALLVWSDLYKQLGVESMELTAPENISFGYKNDGFFAGFKNCKSKKIVPFYGNYLPQDYKVCDL